MFENEYKDEPIEKWIHLKPFGYAPGDYVSKCHRCNLWVTWLDKRAVTCKPCAEEMLSEEQSCES